MRDNGVSILRDWRRRRELPRATKQKPAASKSLKAVAKPFIERLKAGGDGHAWSVVEQMAQLLGLEVVEKGAGK